MADGMRCQQCGGPLTASAGETIIGPTVVVDLDAGPPGTLGRVAGVVREGWCGRCVREWNERMEGPSLTAEHVHDFQPVVSRPPLLGGFEVLDGYRCACCARRSFPTSASLTDPAANAAAALRYLRERYGRAWGAWSGYLDELQRRQRRESAKRGGYDG